MRVTTNNFLIYLRQNGPTTRTLANDEQQAPEGCLWAGFERLALLGLVVIKPHGADWIACRTTPHR